MILSTLHLYLQTYGPNEGMYETKVEFKDGRGEMRLNLPHDLGVKILGVCAEMIREQSAVVANSIVLQLAGDGTLALEQKSPESEQ